MSTWPTAASLIQRIKVEKGCADCGLKSPHPEIYDFDHLPGVDKIEKISNMRVWGSMDALIAEIAKCEVVCANCHRIRTVRRRDHAKNTGWDLRKQAAADDALLRDPVLPFDEIA